MGDREMHTLTMSKNVEAEFDHSEEGCFHTTTRLGGWFRGFLGMAFCCMCAPYEKINEGEVGILLDFGKHRKTLPPGMHYVNPSSQALLRTSVKNMVIDLERQRLLTADNVTIDIDSTLFYKVTNPVLATLRVSNIYQSVKELAYATLRIVVGHFTLQESLQKKSEIAEKVQQEVAGKARDWGVEIQGIYIKDIRLDEELSSSLAAKAKGERVAEAKKIQAQIDGETKLIQAQADASSKIIIAKADVESAKLMAEASGVLNTSAAMQVRYLSALEKIGTGANNKIVFIPWETKEAMTPTRLMTHTIMDTPEGNLVDVKKTK